MHDSVKYSLQKVERAAKRFPGKTLREVIRDMQAEKKLYLPTGLQDLSSIPHLKEVARLSTGAGFGELALMTNQPRSATVEALSRTYLAKIDKYDYQTIVGHAMQRNLNERVNFFRNFRILRSLAK